MAQLIVRNLDVNLVVKLRSRAARNRRSVEAEHREILREVLVGYQGRKSLKARLLAMPDVGTDEDFLRKPEKGRRVRL